jgi:hypothetical protein
MDVLIFDLSALRVAREGNVVVISSPRGESLGTVELPADVSPREALYLSLDKVLRSGRLARPTPSGQRRGYRLAFYNPYTFEIVVAVDTKTVTYRTGEAFEVPEPGVPAWFDTTDRTLTCGRLELAPYVATWQQIAANLHAH